MFDLPQAPANQETIEDIVKQKQELTSAEHIIDRIDQALPQVHDLDTADDELDELSELAKDKFEDLINLGMNVDSRFSGQILQTASMLLGHAITAKQAKIDKKLRMVDLQLKKLRLDQAQQNKKPQVNVVDGQATVIDRNTLLRQLLDKGKE